MLYLARLAVRHKERRNTEAPKVDFLLCIGLKRKCGANDHLHHLSICGPL
jgi:hypothetical protein